jgi:lipopolysaccharide transport system ATP-binding protein
MTTVISVENLSKVYRLGQIGTGTFSYDLKLWWAKMRGKPNPLLRIGETDHGNRVGEDLWALKDVSLTVKQGEVLGIIGKNGAGKSTLLKILSRVTAPTSGRVKVKGRIASLLEVGTGFHPELTGRENTYLNGAILGMSRQEIDRKFDEIVDFSGVEKFIDTPVKRYSSGMYVRLAFAVAAHLEPEILVVDEVLAVGDAEFQKKCLGKMGDVAKEGRTVLFVSHNMNAISSLCSLVTVINNGVLQYAGATKEGINYYLSSSDNTKNIVNNLSEINRIGNGKAKFTKISVEWANPKDNKSQLFYTGSTINIVVDVEASANIFDSNVAVTISDQNDYRLIDINTALDGKFLKLNANEKSRIIFTLEELLLKPGMYTIDLWLGRGGLEKIDSVKNATNFSIFANQENMVHAEIFPGPYQCKFSSIIEKH